MVYKFSDKETLGSGINIDANNDKLVEELHKPIIKNIWKINKNNKRTVYSGFKDNIWGADLAHMQLISKFNKKFRFLVCGIDIFSKYAWIIPLKDKKGVTIVNAFQKILKESKRKPNKIWADEKSEFYNNSFKKWLKGIDI